jgi:hypothetical protein
MCVFSFHFSGLCTVSTVRGDISPNQPATIGSLLRYCPTTMHFRTAHVLDHEPPLLNTISANIHGLQTPCLHLRSQNVATVFSINKCFQSLTEHGGYRNEPRRTQLIA